MLLEVGGQPSRLGHRVISEEEHNLTVRSFHPPIPGGRRSRVGLPQDGESRRSASTTQPVPGAVAGTVINNYDLHATPELLGLLPNSRDHPLKIPQPVVRRNDDARTHFDHLIETFGR
jgi:hypothetical protein